MFFLNLFDISDPIVLSNPISDSLFVLQATVRMVINYKKTQKTVLRVNPQVPLHELLPAICEKCEFDTETTVLLRDVTSSAPLDLSGSLNDYAIREVYAKDTQGKLSFSQIMLLILHFRICYSPYLLHAVPDWPTVSFSAKNNWKWVFDAVNL